MSNMTEKNARGESMPVKRMNVQINKRKFSLLINVPSVTSMGT